VLWVGPHSIASGSVFGAAAVEAWFVDYFAPFGRSFRVEVEELIAVGDSVVVVATKHAEGRQSGAEVSSREHPLVFTMRAGRIIRIDLHGSRTDALEAAGVRE
jgi:ketosteroid isomerase-like protein